MVCQDTEMNSLWHGCFLKNSSVQIFFKLCLYVCVYARVYTEVKRLFFNIMLIQILDCVCNNVVPALKPFDNYQIKNEKVRYELLLLFLASEDCMMLPQ